MSVTVNNLSKIYGSQKAINNISFTINKGEIVGFLGPNGAGKSTTMKIITGYLKANAGTVQVCGITVTENNNETKTNIGYLPEANPLYTEMFVKEYLDFISNTHKIKNKKQAINEIIKTVGLNAEANKKIGQLSKGYKQRVGLAAALIHNPQVLILDEPTNGLDPNQIIEIRELIKQLGKDKIVLFSSHIMQEVEALCDRVIIINKGNIVADDKLSNLKLSNTQNNLSVKFKENITPAIFNSIQNIKQLNAYTLLFATNNPDNLKRKIMQIALDKNLNIVSWENDTTNSLEDIFRNLTTSNQ